MSDEKKALVVIEVLGGVVQAVYSNKEDDEVRVVIVDWDNINSGDQAVDECTLWLSKIGDEARAEVERIGINLADYQN